MTDKKTEFLTHINKERQHANLFAKGHRFFNKIYWYGSVACGALATILGLIAGALVAWDQRLKIEPWMISLFAAAATGLEIFRRNTRWREKSDAYFEELDALDSIKLRIAVALSDAPTQEEFTRLVNDFSAARRRLRLRLERINAREAQAAPDRRPSEQDPEGSAARSVGN